MLSFERQLQRDLNNPNANIELKTSRVGHTPTESRKSSMLSVPTKEI